MCALHLGGRRCLVYILLSIHHCVFVPSVDLLLLFFFLAFCSISSYLPVACADPGMHHEDKKKIKQLIYHQVRDFLFYPRAELSDDEDGESFFRCLSAWRCVSCLLVSVICWALTGHWCSCTYGYTSHIYVSRNTHTHIYTCTHSACKNLLLCLYKVT